MSTRSRIGILEPNGTVTSIYCHFDGYLSHNGRILVNHYQDESKIRELINLGDISILDENIGSRIPFNPNTREINKQVLAYGRDRGETNVNPANHSITNWPDTGRYLYLWKDNCWHMQMNGVFVPICKDSFNVIEILDN